MKKISIFLVLYFYYLGTIFAAPMTFTEATQEIGGCYVGCQWIAAEGEITKETPEVLRRFLVGRKPFFEVAFNSQGGDMLAAMEVGRILSKYKATVYAIKTNNAPDYLKIGRPNYEQEEGQCLDACVFAYLGGWKRVFYSDYLAFTPYQPVLGDDKEKGLTAERQRELAEIAFINAYAKEMRFDPAFIYLGYDKEAVHRLNDKEAEQYAIRYDPREFGVWALGIEENRLFTRTQSHDGKEEVTIACKVDGKVYMEWRMAAERGKNLDEMSEVLQALHVNLWLLGKKLLPKKVDFSLDKGLIILSHELGTFQPDDLQNGYVILAFEGLPHAVETQLKINFTDYESLKAMVPMVIKNCLKK